MKFDVEISKREIESGDIFVTSDDRIRMVIENSHGYCVINLDGMVSSCWYDDIDDLLSNYNIKEVHKSKDLKIVKKEN